MATSSYNNNNRREPSDDKEFNRRKEVDDLISKYARKKAPVQLPVPTPASNIPSTVAHQNYGLQKDYSSSSLRYAANTATTHQREPYNSLYGGASSSNLYSSAARRSSQYDAPAYPEPIYEGAAPRQQKYLATSKSSSNLYLQNPYAGGYLDQASLPTRSLNRQQKTLSMHGAPPSSGRNNNVMETAASIIANAQQGGMGLGQNSDWWNSNQMSANFGPAPLQHDWSSKNLSWNPPAAPGAGGTSTFGAGTSNLGGHPAPPPAAMPVLMFDITTPFHLFTS